MSRIYEALRRADRERRAEREPELGTRTEPAGSIELGNSSSAAINAMSDQVTKHPWAPSVDAIPSIQERGVIVEQFRGLRTRLNQARNEVRLKSVLISSGMPSEGKSFVALNLAISLARHRMNRVLLIDGDLRRPTLHSILGAPKTPGLSDYLTGSKDLASVLQQSENGDVMAHSISEAISNLTFISAGVSGDDSAELVSNGRIESLIASVEQFFDWILIDSPPVLAVTDAVNLARATDAVLLVAREEFTPFEVLQRAQAAFSQSRLLGVVLNGAKHVSRKQHYYYSYYGPESHQKASGRQGNMGRSNG